MGNQVSDTEKKKYFLSGEVEQRNMKKLKTT